MEVRVVRPVLQAPVQVRPCLGVVGGGDETPRGFIAHGEVGGFRERRVLGRSPVLRADHPIGRGVRTPPTRPKRRPAREARTASRSAVSIWKRRSWVNWLSNHCRAADFRAALVESGLRALAVYPADLPRLGRLRPACSNLGAGGRQSRSGWNAASRASTGMRPATRSSSSLRCAGLLWNDFCQYSKASGRLPVSAACLPAASRTAPS